MSSIIAQEEKLVVHVEEDIINVGITEMKPSIIEIGIVGPQGPPGPLGTTYIHHQQVATKIWRVEHDLGGYPSVTIVDSSGRYVIGDVQYLDENTIEVSFSASFAGKAYLN